MLLLAGEVMPLMVVWSVTFASTKQAIPWLLSAATCSVGLACTRHPTFCPYRILHVFAAVTGLTLNLHCNEPLEGLVAALVLVTQTGM